MGIPGGFMNSSQIQGGKRRRDWTDLIFRGLFSTIFIGLGGEHLFADQLIMHLMPEWVPEPRAVSVFSGLLLLTGGMFIVLGYELQKAALLLASFLVAVTITVHGPALFSTPANIPEEHEWLWVILQRSNFVKNLCLLGVCFHLYYYQPRCFSLGVQLERCEGSFSNLWREFKCQGLRLFKS